VVFTALPLKYIPTEALPYQGSKLSKKKKTKTHGCSACKPLHDRFILKTSLYLIINPIKFQEVHSRGEKEKIRAIC
jgi:hypothetical protein